MTARRIWLDVPFAEKDEAKAAGARWDAAAKRWYAPRPGMAALQRWAAAPEVPDLLPGEDRSLGSGLFVDLVPSTCWFTNVRSCVDARDWERLRRMVTRRAQRRCEICGAPEDRTVRRWLEAHERWVYDERSRVQTLRRLICLCTDCHTVTHFGYAQVRGLGARALAHLREVTGMTEAQAEAYKAGVRLSLTVEVHDGDYDGARVLMHDGTLYEILRTYPTGHGTLELSCREVVR